MSSAHVPRRHFNVMTNKIENFIRSSDQFQHACEQAFRQVDVRGRGKVDTAAASVGCAYFFQELRDALKEYGIQVDEPRPEEIRGILAECGYTDHDTLDTQQFEELYVAILKYAAVKCTVGFAQRYGMGMLAGTVGMMVAKRTIRAVPVVGLVASPFLALLPSLIVGPVLGALGVYTFGVVQGDLKAVQRKLFGRGRRGQFQQR